MATYYRRDDNVISGIGYAVPGVTVSYFLQPSLTPATVYTSSTGGGTGGNTNITDGFGHAVAYLAAGTYTITFSGGNIQSYTLPDQLVGATGGSTGLVINSFTGGQTVEIGASVVNPAFSDTFTGSPVSGIITNSDTISSPTTVVSPFTGPTTIVGTFVHTTASTTVFTLTLSDGTNTPTATQNINWVARTFGGVGTAGATGATASGTNSTLTGATGTLSNGGLGNQTTYGPYSPSGQKVYVLMVGAGHTFTSGGFSFPMNTPTAISFTNINGSAVTMYLYESSNLATGTLTLTVTA